MSPVRNTPQHFWARVDIKGKNDCWEFIGSHRGGYGNIVLENKMWATHRLAWYLIYGEIPINNTTQHGSVIRHSCDNPGCCNPNHLRIGTQLDNVNDRTARGRSSRHSQKGESHGGSKLTESDVRAIRISTDTNRNLSMKYGVSRSRISAIKLRGSWSHI